jgi:hypothetical protein
MGQPCCGAGAPATRTCNTGLMCATLPGGAPTCGSF